MRKPIHHQLPLAPAIIDHAHARELVQISAELDAMPEAAELVFHDVVGKRRADTGRDGMTGEQVLRALIVKQMNDFSYEDLAFHLMDSNCYRSFCRLGLGQNPSTATLKRNCKRVQPETLETINVMVVRSAASSGIEKGRKVRTDCTVVNAMIHEPTDSSLLWDCVRVLARNLKKGRQLTPFRFSDHRRRAKKRMMDIFGAKRMDARAGPYRDLVHVAELTMDYAAHAAKALRAFKAPDIRSALLADSIAATLDHFVPLAWRVIDQTKRRVFDGKRVPSSEKTVSIFEDHTDIIVKGRREIFYGHKVCLTAGASGMVLDCTIEEGNPNDATLTTKMIERQIEIYGRPPRQAAFDGGFASTNNLANIKALGVEDVAFNKRCGLEITDMVKSTWVYKRLRNFRAGVEGVISFLKRAFGFARCTWRSLRSFHSYVRASVLSANLLIVARNKIG